MVLDTGVGRDRAAAAMTTATFGVDSRSWGRGGAGGGAARWTQRPLIQLEGLTKVFETEEVEPALSNIHPQHQAERVVAIV